MTRTRVVRVAALIALILGIALVAWRVVLITPSDYEKQMPRASGSAMPPTNSVAPGTGAGDPTGLPASCQSSPEPLVGAQLGLPGHKRSMPMIALGTSADNAPIAPPGNMGNTVGWFDRSAAPGSAKGRTVLTAHTFRLGGALGNDLNHGLLSPGDVIAITDAGGRSACYRFTGALKVFVADYNPDSTLIYDNDSAPQLVIVVCSDYPLVGSNAASRALYYADLVTA